jgi:opacity protein-like surface antigen
MKTASLVAVTLVCAAFSASPAAAQLGAGTNPVRSDTRGLGIGMQINRIGVESGDGSTRVPGAGLGLTLSYGMTDNVSLFGRANMGYRTSQLDVGARYRFASPSSALRPYLEAGVTRLGAISSGQPIEGPSESLRSWGLGATAGAGVEYHFSPRFAVDLGVTHTRGRFSEPRTPYEGAAFAETFSSNRMQMGFTWRP